MIGYNTPQPPRPNPQVRCHLTRLGASLPLVRKPLERMVSPGKQRDYATCDLFDDSKHAMALAALSGLGANDRLARGADWGGC